MKSTIYGKVAFDRKIKTINGRGECFETLSDITEEQLYPMTYSDEEIIKKWDVGYRKNIDIWTIEIIIKVI